MKLEDREDREQQIEYKVVVNDEEQYSIWPSDKENALGWKDAGTPLNRPGVPVWDRANPRPGDLVLRIGEGRRLLAVSSSC